MSSPCNDGAAARQVFVPTEVSRLIPRLQARVRRALHIGPTWESPISLPRIPVLIGAQKLRAARAEVHAALSRNSAFSADPPPADAVKPADIPSVRTRGDGDRALAEIDQDGFAFAMDPEDEPFFNQRQNRLPRLRYRLQIVLRNGYVCVRKQFLPQPLSAGPAGAVWSQLGLPFLAEAAALLRLRDTSHAPRIRDIDLDSRTIWTDYIAGQTLRQVISLRHTPVHDLDIRADPVVSRMSAEELERREIAMCTSFDADVKQRIRDAVVAMNRKGVAPQDVKPGNVLIGKQTGIIYWVDFECAWIDSFPDWPEYLYRHHCLANQWFDLGFITREQVAAYDKQQAVYSPVDLGPLGQLGDVSDVEAGEGRWRWLLRRQTNWAGKRILDLGTNNCLYAMRELQAGAAEVHCVERDPVAFKEASFVRAAIEQTEAIHLSLQIHQTDIYTFLTTTSFGEEYFDLATALCSIYYLDRDQIAESVRIIHRIARECWLQANIWTRRASEELAAKASVEFLGEQLRTAGFDDVTVIAPRNYHRPLLVGRKRG